MKSWIKILSFLMLVLLLTAEDCGDSGNSYVPREDIYQTIEKEFTGADISAENRIAFEKRAIQKLKDVADYINIYADSSYTADFRIQARQMIEDAFYSEKDLKQFLTKLALKEDTVQNILVTQAGVPIDIQIDSILISKEFTATSNLEYEGELRFNLISRESNSLEEIKIVAIKRSKQFGTESLSVWELFIRMKDN